MRAGDAAVRPLLVRPGARFTCHRDGLCCTDVHLLGPVSAREREAIDARVKNAVVRGRLLEVLAPRANGHCVFLEAGRGCRIYDAGLKPRSCDRFPFTLAATPEGGRVATDHRCPCRTMGERRALSAGDVGAVLLDSAGRLWADRRISARIRIAHRRSVSFARYLDVERPLLDALARGDRTALGDVALPTRADGLWDAVAGELDVDTEHPTRWSLMQRAFARALLATQRGDEIAAFERPWAESFEHAERRSRQSDPQAMLDDWIADVIWGLEWSLTHTFTQVRAELAARAAIALRLARCIGARHGARADTAMAEAIAIVEVSGLSDAWLDAIARLRA